MQIMAPLNQPIRIDYRFKEFQVSHHTQQILQGLNYIHSCNVIQRGLKCAYILVTESGNIGLAA